MSEIIGKFGAAPKADGWRPEHAGPPPPQPPPPPRPDQFQPLGFTQEEQAQQVNNRWNTLVGNCMRYRELTPWSRGQISSALDRLTQPAGGGWTLGRLENLYRANPDRLIDMVRNELLRTSPGPSIGAPGSSPGMPLGVQLFGPPNPDLGTGTFWQGLNAFGNLMTPGPTIQNPPPGSTATGRR